MFKVFDFLCVCGERRNDQLVEKDEVVLCQKCKEPMNRLFPCAQAKEARGNFKPFWSDTFEMRVNDREDLTKLKQLRKEHGLECIGHRRAKPDRKLIRRSYEN